MLKSKINDQISTSCFSSVGDKLKSAACSGNAIKYGKTKAGKQRYLCKVCVSAATVIRKILHVASSLTKKAK